MEERYIDKVPDIGIQPGVNIPGVIISPDGTYKKDPTYRPPEYVATPEGPTHIIYPDGSRVVIPRPPFNPDERPRYKEPIIGIPIDINRPLPIIDPITGLPPGHVPGIVAGPAVPPYILLGEPVLSNERNRIIIEPSNNDTSDKITRFLSRKGFSVENRYSDMGEILIRSRNLPKIKSLLSEFASMQRY